VNQFYFTGIRSSRQGNDMSTSQGKSADQGYFVGSDPPESANHEAPSVKNSSVSNRTVVDTTLGHALDRDAVAASTRVSRLPVVRLPHAAPLPVVESFPRVVTQISPPDAISIGSETWGRTPTRLWSRRSLSGAKAFLIIVTIAALFALFFFTFESLPPKVDVVSAWLASLIDRQAGVPAPLPKAPPSTIGPQDIAPVVQPTPDQKNGTTESRTAEDGRGAVPGPDGESQRRREAQESSPPKSECCNHADSPAEQRASRDAGPVAVRAASCD
jgi:hypothetical protein